MFLTDRLVVDDQVTLDTTTQNDDLVSRNGQYLDVFAVERAKNFNDQIRRVLRSFNLEYFVLVAINVDIVRILRLAELTSIYLVHSRETVLVLVVCHVPLKPLPQALQVNPSGRASAVAWYK